MKERPDSAAEKSNERARKFSTRDVGIEDAGVRIGLGKRGLRVGDIVTLEVLGPEGEEYMQQLQSRLAKK